MPLILGDIKQKNSEEKSLWYWEWGGGHLSQSAIRTELRDKNELLDH